MAEGIRYTISIEVDGPMRADHKRFVDAIAAAIQDLDPDERDMTVEDDGPGDYTRATDPRDNGRNER